MLIEQSRSLIELSQRKTKIYQHAKNFNGFQERQRQLSEALEELSPLVECLTLFRQRGLTSHDFSYRVAPLLQSVINHHNNFRQDYEWILDNKNFNGRRFEQDLTKLKELLNQEMLQAWRNYLTRRLPSTNSEILDLLARIESFKDTVRTIKNLSEQIKRDQFPKNVFEFDSTESLIQQLEQLWNSLNTSEVPTAVLMFLKASASREGAPLNLLTSEVQQWIREHNVSEVLRVRLL